MSKVSTHLGTDTASQLLGKKETGNILFGIGTYNS